ncbi:MAG: hypothetical protein L0216_03210 [Planctomycetales bacterium]|nr:hypothetical protein [Planctomycetales bacterium]
MNKITLSGVYYDEFGQLMLVTQGLGGYTLVANKKILFRLYTDLSVTSCVTVLATITYKVFGFSIKKSFVIPTGSLLIDTTGPLGSSVGVLFNGDVFPHHWLQYEVDFHVYGDPASVPHFRLPEVEFLMPGRLRLLIHNLRGKAPWGTQIEPSFSWLVDMFQSLERLSSMLPVCDGLKFGLTHTDAGLCFSYGENIDTWPQVCPSGGAPPCTAAEMVALNLSETQQINASGTLEHVDATVSWRPRDPTFPPPGGEGVGGKAINYDSPPGTGLALVVGGNRSGKEWTGPIMAQEIGHLFGLEPRDSPHFEDPLDPLHSKDPGHSDPFAFDFYLLKHYQPPAFGFVGDVMNNFGGGLGQGRDMVLYNAFDWEHLRKRFVKLPGVARSAGKRPSRKGRAELATALQRVYGDEPGIRVSSPERALPARQGFAWHWTHLGFRLAKGARGKRTRSGLSASVEGIRSWLEDLGVSEAYAPVGDRPLRGVIHPNPYTSLHRKEFDVFDWPESRPRRR